MPGSSVSEHKDLNLQDHTAKDIANYLNTNFKLSPATLLYIDCHGYSDNFQIGDRNLNKTDGISYLTNIFEVQQQNPSLTQFQGNSQQHLRISLIMCRAAKEKTARQEKSFAETLHRKLREEQNIFCEITARVDLVTVALNNDDNYYCKLTRENQTAPYCYKKPHSKITYYWWQDPDGIIRQKWRFDY